ncbi:ornithine monooxygenase [Roseovarius sp. A21]|uniref:Ornithine monooxygenase n=1 Tax=Roseovarius bejariae TaxID=2576383 RepID=A0A844D6T3_9RHOB|nr:SidA/IucD/PvdA family monooxygenase [Roseovarius bejariae]MRU17098.1 ornithine monooxygenase [Roseovarius bejariae]
MTNMSHMRHAEAHIYDCIGVGFGPSNMALAIALGEVGALDNCLFLEAQDDILWHPGMLLDGADIQHNPLRDLVTPRNPASPYGFLAYLKAQGRLFDYLNLSAPYPPRTEYAGYVNWVGRQFLDYVSLNTRVVAMTYTSDMSGTPLVAVLLDDGRRLLARSVSFAPGRSNYIPAQFESALGDDIVHLSGYRFARDRWLGRLDMPRVAVVGGSQSAIEILLDLAGRARLTGISRGFGFKQKDLSAFTEQIYYPSFVDMFFDAGEGSQHKITRELWRSNYGAADPDVIEALNFKLYEQRVRNGDSIEIVHNCEIAGVEKRGDAYAMSVTDRLSGAPRTLEVDGIVLATGFRNFGNAENQEPYHPLLDGLATRFETRADGGIAIARDYRVATLPGAATAPVFINGLCETTHGFGDAGSFSLLSVRSEQIARALVDHIAEAGAPTVPQPEELTNV